jgi:hypothetical protein
MSLNWRRPQRHAGPVPAAPCARPGRLASVAKSVDARYETRPASLLTAVIREQAATWPEPTLAAPAGGRYPRGNCRCDGRRPLPGCSGSRPARSATKSKQSRQNVRRDCGAPVDEDVYVSAHAATRDSKRARRAPSAGMMAVPFRLMADLRNVWICAQDLQLIRADRVVSLLIPVGPAYGAASPGDPNLHRAIYAEIDGGTEGDTISRVKLADCGKSPGGELLAGLARALGSARDAELTSVDGCLFVFAEQDAAGRLHWITVSQLPAAWPQSTSSEGAPAALTRSPVA